MAISNKNKDLLSLMKNNIAQKLENQARESVRTGFLKYEGSEKIRKKIITTKNSENLTLREVSKGQG